MQGILFNEPTGMLSATIKGKKTITRRLGGLEEVNYKPDKWELKGIVNGHYEFEFDKRNIFEYCKPRFKVGEVVYIKESHQKDEYGKLWYKVDHVNDVGGEYNFDKWSNPMFAGKDSARHFIKILSVRVERLQDITEEDCILEGIARHKEGDFFIYPKKTTLVGLARESFASLIDYLNGKGTWEKNPWVWRYEFETNN